MSTHFDPTQFASNQPQALGRGHRPDAENEAMSAFRAQLQKQTKSNDRRQATRLKNQQLRAAQPEAAVASAPQPSSATNPLGVAPVTPSSTRPALQNLPAQLTGVAPTASLMPVFPRGAALAAATPTSTPAASSPLSTFPVRGSSVASTPMQPEPPRRTMEAPQYPELQSTVLQPAASAALNPINARLASMTQEQIENLDSMLRLMEQGSERSVPPFNSSFESLISFSSQVRNAGDSASLSSPFSTNTGFPDSDDSPSWPGERPRTPEPDQEPLHPLPEDPEPRSDVEDNSHQHAQSSLAVRMQDVPVHQKRPRGRRNGATTTAVTDSEDDERPPQRPRRATKPRKRSGRNQPSRSIKDISLARQPIVKAAYAFVQREVVCASGFPVDSPSGKPGASDDEYGNMVLFSWDDGHKVLDVPYVGNPATPERNLIRSRVPTTRLAFKRVAELLVPIHYSLVNLQTLPNLTPELKAKTIEENRDIIAKIEHTFYYQDPYNQALPDSMYRHPIIQAAFNLACFGKKADCRAYYFDDVDAVPVETIALIVTAIKCALDQWKTGQQVDVKFDNDTYAAYYKKALAHLDGWVEYTSTQSIDVAGIMLKDMLRAARESSGIVKEKEREEDVFVGFSTSSYAANQPSTS
ncbi:hypothetical protein C8R45DRAFT_1219724 [Mycena sanguinolenta]|nr:hypothetical protein C8R45DRAFT_1219724 [Mycena sanguinolenta]